LLAGQGIEQCNTESGAESALNDIDVFMDQVDELRFDDMQQFRQDCSQLLGSELVVSYITVFYSIVDLLLPNCLAWFIIRKYVNSLS